MRERKTTWIGKENEKKCERNLKERYFERRELYRERIKKNICEGFKGRVRDLGKR